MINITITTPQPFPFSDIPLEIQEKILQYLSRDDISTLCQTSFNIYNSLQNHFVTMAPSMRLYKNRITDEIYLFYPHDWLKYSHHLSAEHILIIIKTLSKWNAFYLIIHLINQNRSEIILSCEDDSIYDVLMQYDKQIALHYLSLGQYNNVETFINLLLILKHEGATATFIHMIFCKVIKSDNIIAFKHLRPIFKAHSRCIINGTHVRNIIKRGSTRILTYLLSEHRDNPSEDNEYHKSLYDGILTEAIKHNNLHVVNKVVKCLHANKLTIDSSGISTALEHDRYDILSIITNENLFPEIDDAIKEAFLEMDIDNLYNERCLEFFSLHLQQKKRKTEANSTNKIQSNEPEDISCMM